MTLDEAIQAETEMAENYERERDLPFGMYEHNEEKLRKIFGSYHHQLAEWLSELKALQPKTGHWIMKHRTHNEVKHYTGQDEMGETHTISVLERYEVDEHYCSECGKRAGDTSQDYCCACGARMVEPQESEG